MKFLKQSILKRKNTVSYKEELLELDEEKTNVYNNPSKIYLKKHRTIYKTELGMINGDTGKAFVINFLDIDKAKQKQELIAAYKGTLIASIANSELRTNELKAVLAAVKKNGMA